jgi:hypothetical protein
MAMAAAFFRMITDGKDTQNPGGRIQQAGYAAGFGVAPRRSMTGCEVDPLGRLAPAD